jgi:glycosyltransferase involved in cell wall biosynthesis
MSNSIIECDGNPSVPDAARAVDSDSVRDKTCRGRVLIVVENLPVPFDRRVWSEATALQRNGYQVSVICPKGKNATASHEVIDGIHIYRHWMPLEASGMGGYLLEYSAALFWEFLLSLKVMATRGFDAIQACNPPDMLFLVGAFYKYIFGKRFVFDHHDISPELFEAKFGRRGLFWRMLVLLERWTFKVADYSIATNESYRALAIERGGMAPDRVFVVRTGPNPNRVHTVSPDEKWKRGRRFLVAYVGVIARQEGLDLLLDSVTYLRQYRQRDDIQFVIVGGGPDQEDMVKLCKSAGLDDTVTFTGRVDDQTLFTILSTADVCVNPDRPNAMNDKSTMIKIMEYMALGKPIVQFDLTEGRNSALDASLYARKGDTTDFGDKIVELLDDPAKAAKMSVFGRERVKNVLAWEHEEKKLLKAWETILGGEGSARRRHLP